MIQYLCLGWLVLSALSFLFFLWLTKYSVGDTE